MSERPTPTREQLDRYATKFSESATLEHFNVRVDFPDQHTIRAVIDPVADAQRGGLGSDAVNGGIIAALFDLVIGASAALVDPTRRSATINLSMNFERPVRGDRVVARAWVDRAGKAVVFSSAEIVDEREQVCARAHGVVRISSKPWKNDGSPAVN